MWRICDLFEFAPLIRCEALKSASVESIETSIREALSAIDVDRRAFICKIDANGRVAIQVAFERNSRREPPHEMRRSRAMEIFREVSTGIIGIIQGDLTGNASRWIGSPGGLYKVSEISFARQASEGAQYPLHCVCRDVVPDPGDPHGPANRR